MACADDHEQPLSQRTKKLLGHGAVVVQSMFKMCSSTYNILSWRVLNYSELKHNVLYYQLFENTNMKCVFKMLKTKRLLHVCLRSDDAKRKPAQFYVDDEADRVSLVTYTKELLEGLYVGDFLNELLLAKDSKYLKDGMITVSFRYLDINQPILEQASLKDPDPIMDQDEFYNDLKHMYLNSLYSDFTIRVDSYKFKVHKFVLASRSEFFQDFFTQHPTAHEYTLEASPRIVHQMLVYVYCGELQKVEMASMLEMYDVAHGLKINSLTNQCLCFISRHTNENNYGVISVLARKLKSLDLRNIVNNFRKKLDKNKKQMKDHSRNKNRKRKYQKFR